MPINTPSSSYNAMIKSVRLVRDCVEGTSAVKSGPALGGGGPSGLRGSLYLPPPNPDDLSDQNVKRYESYKCRASYVNFTGSTQTGLVGLIESAEYKEELSNEIEYISENATGSGVGLSQLKNKIAGELLAAGNYGLLVEFPESSGGTIQDTKDLRAYISCYPVESIINIRTANIGGKVKIDFVVLKERIQVGGDKFTPEFKDSYRMLFMDDGVYRQALFDDEGNQIGEVITPRKSDGSLWDEIPFMMPGSIDNSPDYDKPVLLDIANVNIAHYRNSADFEESSFMVGQPTLSLSGLSKQWIDTILKDGVMLGSRSAILLPEGSSAQLLQANPNTMPQEGMREKESQMVKLGARIISDQSAQETVEAVRIRFGSQTSQLARIVSNIEDAINKCLAWVGLFMGSNQESFVEIGTKFYDEKADPQMIIAQMQMIDRGVIGNDTLRDYLRRKKLTDKTDEELDAESMRSLM